MGLSDWVSLIALVIALGSAVIAADQWRIARAAEDRAVRAEARYRAPWRLEHARGGRFSLINDGFEPVHDVDVAGGIRCVIESGDPSLVPAGSSLTVLIAGASGVPPIMEVTWRRDGSARDESRLRWSRAAYRPPGA